MFILKIMTIRVFLRDGVSFDGIWAIAIIVVVDLVPIQSHLLSRRPQAQHPLY